MTQESGKQEPRSPDPQDTDYGFDPKWLPEEPHRGAILKALDTGFAYVEECGYGYAPMLMFQDGGAIELPRVRNANTERGLQLIAGELASAPDQTKHRDVCGSIDEMKRRIDESPSQAAADHEVLVRLLRDVRHMLGRLQKRRESYEQFVRDLTAVCSEMAKTPRPAPDLGFARIDDLLGRLEDATAQSLARDKEDLFARAEKVRDVANAQEHCISRHKDGAIRAHALYKKIKSGRNWRDREAELCRLTPDRE